MTEIKEINVADLRVDEQYQRGEVSVANTKKLASSWNEEALEPLTVSERGGAYYVVDGAQRLAAARIVGKSTLPCRVLSLGGAKEEAAVFSEIANKRRALTPYQKFKAAVVAGKRPEIDIKKFLDSVGMEITTSRTGEDAIEYPASIVAAFKTNERAAMASIVASSLLCKGIGKNMGWVFEGFFAAICRGFRVSEYWDRILGAGYHGLLAERNRVAFETKTSCSNLGKAAIGAAAVLAVVNKGRRVKIRFDDDRADNKKRTANRADLDACAFFGIYGVKA